MTMFLKNLSIRLKILLPVGLLGCLVVILGLTSLNSAHEIKAAGEAISNQYVVCIEQLDEISTSYQSLRRVAFAHIVEPDAKGKKTLREEADSLKAEIEKVCGEYEKMLDAEGTEAFEQFKADYDNYLTIFDQILECSSNHEESKASELANNDLREAGVALTAEMDDMIAANKDNMSAAAQQQQTVYRKVIRACVILIVLSILVLLFVVYICWTWVCKRLININAQLRDVIASIDAGKGDLTRRVQCFCSDEIGTLADGINSFIKTLQKIMGQINSSSGQLGSIVSLVADKVSTANNNSNDISSVMGNLSSSMEMISETVADIKENVGIVDENIAELSDASQGLRDYAVEMQKRAENLEQNAVENRQTTSDVMNEIIGKLQNAIEGSRSVERVNDLTDEILSISNQTNLLSLNASIEAARAGEAGKGFAVVADEISQLANSSRETANNIQTINQMVVEAVQELIDSAGSIVNYTRENILPDYEGFVGAGQQYSEDAVRVNETVTRFSEMSANLQKLMESITDSVNGINHAVDESARGATDVATNTSDLVRDIGEIADAMNNNRQVAGNLNDEAERFINL